MDIKIDNIIRTAILVNGDTLFVKLACLMRLEDIKKLQSRLQEQTEKIKVIVLPNAAEFDGVRTKDTKYECFDCGGIEIVPENDHRKDGRSCECCGGRVIPSGHHIKKIGG